MSLKIVVRFLQNLLTWPKNLLVYITSCTFHVLGGEWGKSRGTVRDKCLDNTTQEHCLCYPQANPAAILLFLYFDLIDKQSTLTLKNKFHLW